MNGPRIEVSDKEYNFYKKLDKLSFMAFVILIIQWVIIISVALIFRNSEDSIPDIARHIMLIFTILTGGVCFSPLIYQFIVVQRLLKKEMKK